LVTEVLHVHAAGPQSGAELRRSFGCCTSFRDPSSARPLETGMKFRRLPESVLVQAM
jgi:hypothetical protein